MNELVTYQAPEKILIIRLSSIGDIVLTTPVIRILKQKFPGSRIDFVIKKQFAELLVHHPGIHHLYVFDKCNKLNRLKTIKQQIRAEKYDLVIDLHKNFRSYYLTFLSRAKQIVRYKKGVLRRFLFVKFKLNLYREIIPIYRRYLACLKPLQIFYDDRGLELFLHNGLKLKIIERYKSFFEAPGTVIIGIVPGAKHATKRWQAEGFLSTIHDLTEKRQAKIIIFGGKADQDIIPSFEIENNQHVLDTTGKLSIAETAALMSHCDVVMTNDSGLMHIASALKKKVVAIFGSTTEEFGFFPYATEHIVIQQHGLSCRPCSHVGRKNCPRGHFRCMKEIRTERVIDAVERILVAKK